MSHHYHPLESCLARIFYGDPVRRNISCGAGVALPNRWVLTCAHVIKDALQLKNDINEKPEQKIVLDFPLSSSNKAITAKVIFWDVESDIAGLEVIGEFPEEVKPASLYITDNLWGHRIQAFGFPDKYPAGNWADSELRGPNTFGWIEIIDSQTTGYYVQQGFSGGPVWDADLQCCIGIVVASDKNAALRASYLIPAHKIAEKWKDLPVQRKSRPKQKRELPNLLLYRMNRREQEDDLRRLYEKNNVWSPLPMVAIIHGDDKQAHDMFLARLANEFIPILLKTHTQINRFQVPWPTHIQKIDGLSTELVKGVADAILQMPDASCEDVQRALAAYDSPVMVEMELLTDDWMKHKEGILEVILDFWNNWPTLVPRQNLFVFLYITHKVTDMGWLKQRMYLLHKKQIFIQLEHCAFHHYTRINSAVLSELTNVSHTETRSWARAEAQEYFDGDLTTLLAKIRVLFEKEESIPMEPLAFRLREILISNSGD